MSTHLLGLGASIIIGMNAMIGAGIFSLPSALISGVGPLSILAYFLATVLVTAMAYALTRVALRAPQGGAFFEYTRLWAGHTGGLIAAGIYIAGLIVALGLLAQITSFYLSVYAPTVNPDILATGIVLAMAALVCAGTHANRIGQIILLALTLIPMALIALLSLTTASISRLTPFAPHGWGALVPALKSIVFGFFGFEAIPALARHMRNPEKIVGPAVIFSVIGVGVTYCAFVAAIILGIPAELFTRPDIPLSDVLATQFPAYPWIVSFVRLSIIITIVGTIHAMLWAISELIISCSQKLSPKLSLYKNNLRAPLTVVQATLGCAACIIAVVWAIKSIDLFFSIVALLITLAFAASIVPLITLFRRSLHDLIAGIVGLAAASVIIFCAIDGLIKHLSGSLF